MVLTRCTYEEIKEMISLGDFALRFTNYEELSHWVSNNISFPINFYQDFTEDYFDDRPVILLISMLEFYGKRIDVVSIEEERKIDDLREFSLKEVCYPKEIYYCFRDVKEV